MEYRCARLAVAAAIAADREAANTYASV